MQQTSVSNFGFFFFLLWPLFSRSPKLFHGHFQTLKILEECAIQIHAMSTIKNIFLCQISGNSHAPDIALSLSKQFFFCFKQEMWPKSKQISNKQHAANKTPFSFGWSPLSVCRNWVIGINVANVLFKPPMGHSSFSSMCCIGRHMVSASSTLIPKVYVFFSFVSVCQVPPTQEAFSLDATTWRKAAIVTVYT